MRPDSLHGRLIPRVSAAHEERCRHGPLHRTARPPARPRRLRHRAQLGALARRAAAADRRDGGAAHRRALRGARRDRQVGPGARALPDDRDRRRDARGDRRPAARARHPRRAHPRGAAAAAARPCGRPALGRLPAPPPADEDLPRRPDPAARRRLREPLPDGEGGRRGLHRGGRGADAAPGGAGGGRDRERAALRGVDALAAPARVAERDRGRARLGARARAAARARRAPPARARRRAARADRAPG